MKKKLTLSLICLFAISAYGQDANEQDLLKNVNWKEDSTEITTINDIIKMQQEVTNKNFKERHYRDVWSRKSYLNISYNTTTLTPDQNIPTGVGGAVVPEFKSNWGVSLQLGRSYALHKSPIANILQFNIDYAYIDLNVNHFAQEGDGKNLYDSNNPQKIDGKNYFYTPWNLEKYDLNYGMAIGPSISIAPFTSVNTPGLHHVKLNAFFHVGYHVSLLWMTNDKDADVNQNATEGTEEKANYDKMKDNLKLDLGHGLITSFGFSLTWKFIGFGYEHRSGALKYKSLSTSDFGSETYKFKASTNRIFIQFRM